MERVHRASQLAFERLRSAAIAIREIDPQQRHIGLLYADNGLNRVSFLHLAWHFDLRCEAPRTEYSWVDPAIPTPRLVQLAAVCRLVWRANGKGRIPYGFGPPADCLQINEAPDAAEDLEDNAFVNYCRAQGDPNITLEQV